MNEIRIYRGGQYPNRVRVEACTSILRHVVFTKEEVEEKGSTVRRVVDNFIAKYSDEETMVVYYWDGWRHENPDLVRFLARRWKN